MPDNIMRILLDLDDTILKKAAEIAKTQSRSRKKFLEYTIKTTVENCQT